MIEQIINLFRTGDKDNIELGLLLIESQDLSNYFKTRYECVCKNFYDWRYLFKKTLTEIDLSYLGLKVLPDCIFDFPNLHKICLNDNSFDKFPIELNKFKNLGHLDLDCNLITEIPKEFETFTSIYTLRLKYNQISEIPNFIKDMDLLYLNLKNNYITEIPKGFEHINITI